MQKARWPCALKSMIINLRVYLHPNFPNFAATMEEEGYSRLSKLEKDEYYYSPEGYVVFTEKYLLKRGYCCENGCRHCPYGFRRGTGRYDKK